MDEFANNLLRDQGVPDDMEVSIREQLKHDLTEQAVDMVNKRLIESMDVATAAEFGKPLDEQPENLQSAQSFIEEHVPDRQTITATALLEVRSLYLGAKA